MVSVKDSSSMAARFIPVSLISVHGIGAFAAIAFDNPEDYLGRTVALARDRLTPPQIAETLGRAVGLTARNHQVPIERVRAFDEQVARMFTYFNEKPYAAIDVVALRKDHPGLMDLPSWLRTTNWKP
jgi:uncharacterized protein YbjT (DUF2867 family)